MPTRRDFTAVVIHSDFERTGTFSCSNELLDRLHENVVWGMRGNFVDVPTDCPQRDERLGWTGDLQVFAPTATFLFDVAGFLADWLDDLRAEQAAATARCRCVVPAGREAFGVAVRWCRGVGRRRDGRAVDRLLALRRRRAARAAVRQHARAGSTTSGPRPVTRMLWPEEFQLGDWLDPDSPPTEPWLAKTDALLVAIRVLRHSAQTRRRRGRVLGRDERRAASTTTSRSDVRAAFRHEFSPRPDCSAPTPVTAYSLALVFDLFEDPRHRVRAVERIAYTDGDARLPDLDRLRRHAVGAAGAHGGGRHPDRLSAADRDRNARRGCTR